MYHFVSPQNFIAIGVVIIILSKQMYHTWITCMNNFTVAEIVAECNTADFFGKTLYKQQSV